MKKLLNKILPSRKKKIDELENKLKVISLKYYKLEEETKLIVNQYNKLLERAKINKLSLDAFQEATNNHPELKVKQQDILNRMIDG